MPCFHPLEGRRTPSGGFSFGSKGAFIDLPPMYVPCGQCIGCRLERGRQWTVRLMHEARQHQDKCFITLTYDDAHLPKDGSLVKADFQNFMKRLRKEQSHKRISYFMCGEYGTINWRPHYHAIIFGHTFMPRMRPSPEIPLPGMVRQGAPKRSYRSPSLSRLWDLGFSTVGSCTVESCGYVAAYCLKKVTGVLADDHYKRIDPDTGEIYWLVPEFAHMSTRPAIGKGWFDRHGADVRNYDGVFVRGKRQSVPRYYDKLRARADELELAHAKLERRIEAFSHADNNTAERLAVREEVAVNRNKLKKRNL